MLSESVKKTQKWEVDVMQVTPDNIGSVINWVKSKGVDCQYHSGGFGVGFLMLEDRFYKVRLHPAHNEYLGYYPEMDFFRYISEEEFNSNSKTELQSV